MPKGYPGTGPWSQVNIKTEKLDKATAHGRAITSTARNQPQVFCVTELEWDERVPGCAQSDVKLLGCFSTVEKANTVIAEWHTRRYVDRSVAEFDQYQLMKDQGLCQLNVAVGGQTWQVAVEAVEMDEEFTMSLLESTNNNTGAAPSASARPQYSSQDIKKLQSSNSRVKKEPGISPTGYRSQPASASKGYANGKIKVEGYSAKQRLDAQQGSLSDSTPPGSTQSDPVKRSNGKGTPQPSYISSKLAGKSSASKQNGVKRKADRMHEGDRSPSKPAWVDTSLKPIPPLASKNTEGATPVNKTTNQLAKSEPKNVYRPLSASSLSSVPATPDGFARPPQSFKSAGAASSQTTQRRATAHVSSDESDVDSDLERRRKKKIKRELQKLGVIVGQP